MPWRLQLPACCGSSCFTLPSARSRGLRFGNMVQMRDIWAEEIEAALAGQKTAKEALDNAVARGNAMLRTFEKTAK